MSINITSSEGLLFINPFPLYLREELKFWEMRVKMEDGVYRDKKTGQLKEFKKKVGYEGSSKELFSLMPDGVTGLTHRGLLRRILNSLNQQGVSEVKYHDLTPLPQFHFGPEVIKGLYPEQARAVMSVLCELGTGQRGWESNPAFIRPGIGSGGAMLSATMATGKTHILGAFIRCFPTENILVVTKNVPVVLRLEEGLNELLPELGGVGLYYGGCKRKSRVTVCSEAMIEHFDSTRVGVILHDEVHNASGDQISSALLQFNRSVKIGVSGTIEKHPKKLFIESIYGPIVDTISDQEAEELGRVSPVKVYAVGVPNGPNVDSDQDEQKERWGITRNKCRNQIIKAVCDRVPEDMQLIVFVRTIEHIEELTEKGFLTGYTVYHGQLKPKERRELEKKITSGEIKRIVANDALGEGVNTKNMMVSVEAGWNIAERGVSQRAGRNRRKRDDKNIGIIVTFQDNWKNPTDTVHDLETTCLKRRADEKLGHYRARGWPVIRVDRPEEIDFQEIRATQV